MMSVYPFLVVLTANVLTVKSVAIGRNEDSLFDICARKDETVYGRSFISSPGYPSVYPPYSDCTCQIFADDGHTTFLISFLESSIERSYECRNDRLDLFVDEVHAVSKCGEIPENYNMTKDGRVLTVVFATNHQGEEKGFLLAVEAYGMLHLKCGLQILDSKPYPTDSFPPDESNSPPLTNEHQPVRTDAEDTLAVTSRAAIGEVPMDTGLEEQTIEYTAAPAAPADGTGAGAAGEGMTEAALSDASQTDQPGIQTNKLSSSAVDLSAILSISLSIVLMSVIFLVISFLGAWIRRRRRYTREISKATESNFLRLPPIDKDIDMLEQPQPADGETDRGGVATPSDAIEALNKSESDTQHLTENQSEGTIETDVKERVADDTVTSSTDKNDDVTDGKG